MRPVCKFYQRGECKDPRCRFAHPLEYPVYIYSTPGTDIHPDELRATLMRDEAMHSEADNIWLNNYKIFCELEGDEPYIDILAQPDYFSPPFDVQRVTTELGNMRGSIQVRWGERPRTSTGYRQPDQRDQRDQRHSSGGAPFRNDYREDYNRQGSRFDGWGSGGSRTGPSRFDNRFDNRNDNRPRPSQGSRFDSGGSKGWAGSVFRPSTPSNMDQSSAPPRRFQNEPRQSQQSGGGWYGNREHNRPSQPPYNSQPRDRQSGDYSDSYSQHHGFGRAPRSAKDSAASDESLRDSPEYDYHRIPHQYK